MPGLPVIQLSFISYKVIYDLYDFLVFVKGNQIFPGNHTNIIYNFLGSMQESRTSKYVMICMTSYMILVGLPGKVNTGLRKIYSVYVRNES